MVVNLLIVFGVFIAAFLVGCLLVYKSNKHRDDVVTRAVLEITELKVALQQTTEKVAAFQQPVVHRVDQLVAPPLPSYEEWLGTPVMPQSRTLGDAPEEERVEALRLRRLEQGRPIKYDQPSRPPTRNHGFTPLPEEVEVVPTPSEVRQRRVEIEKLEQAAFQSGLAAIIQREPATLRPNSFGEIWRTANVTNRDDLDVILGKILHAVEEYDIRRLPTVPTGQLQAVSVHFDDDIVIPDESVTVPLEGHSPLVPGLMVVDLSKES